MRPLEAAATWRQLYRAGNAEAARALYNEHSLVAPDAHSEPLVQAVAKTPSRTGGNVQIGQRLGNEFQLVPQGSTDLGGGLQSGEFHIHDENGVPIGAAGVSYRGDPQTATDFHLGHIESSNNRSLTIGPRGVTSLLRQFKKIYPRVRT